MQGRIAELEEALLREKEVAAKAASAAAAAVAVVGTNSGRFEEFVRRKQQEGNMVSLYNHYLE